MVRIEDLTAGDLMSCGAGLAGECLGLTTNRAGDLDGEIDTVCDGLKEMLASLRMHQIFEYSRRAPFQSPVSPF